MNNNYLIPANSKKSQLILGYFTGVDLFLLGFGCGLTLILLILFGRDLSIAQDILILLPALISGFLVMPVLYYHNVLQLIINCITFLINPRRYYWRGWCCRDESNE
jgi:hypothetical protein